jgi:hypothetical protein
MRDRVALTRGVPETSCGGVDTVHVESAFAQPSLRHWKPDWR